MTVSTFLVYMYLPTRLWHHHPNTPRVHDCIYLQDCGITLSIFIMDICLPARLWHHRIHIPHVHVFTCMAVASPYPYSSCTCIYLQDCGIIVSIFFLYRYLPARLWHHCILISHVHAFTCKTVASPYQHFSST